MNLKQCIEKLEKNNRVVHVKTPVDIEYELAGVAREFEGKEVVIFDNIKNREYPLAIGLWWNRDNLACIFDCKTEELTFLFQDAVKTLSNNPIMPILVEQAPAQEVIFDEVDLYRIPVPTLALKDGGPYFDNCVVIAKDPDTGVRNTSIHRFMVTGKNRMGMLMDVGRHLRDYYERAEKKGVSLEITINNGVHPSYYAAAITPSSAAPIDVDELAVASYLMKEPARLCKSLTVEVEGIADAQMIIEAEILPNIREPEGPFGEVSGYYATKDDRWVVNVKAITSCRNPLIHTLLPGKEVWNSSGLGVESNIFGFVSKQVKGLKNVYLSHGGSHYHAIIQIDPPFNGMSKNAILATFASFPDLQMVTAVNSDVNLYDADEVERAMVTRCDPQKDIIIIKDALCHELNPITDNGVGAKMGFDCTYPIPKEDKFEKIQFMKVDISKYDIKY